MLSAGATRAQLKGAEKQARPIRERDGKAGTYNAISIFSVGSLQIVETSSINVDTQPPPYLLFMGFWVPALEPREAQNANGPLASPINYQSSHDFLPREHG